MPDQENVAVISLIWQKFRDNGDETFPVEMIETLRTHKYVQIIPLLAHSSTMERGALMLRRR
jgi:hypothetical protein